jgi:MFS family permease
MPSDRLPLIRLVFFSAGLFAVQTFWGFLGATLPLFLIELTPSATVVGLVLSASGIFGIIMPIAAGTLSDRVQWRFGRRKPFIAVGWIVVVIVLMVLPGATTLFAAIPLILILFAAFFFTMGPYFAFLADISPPERRGGAAGVMFLVGGTGGILFLLFAAPLWDTDRRLVFLWTAAVIVVSITILFIGVPEPPEARGTRPGPGILQIITGDRRLMTFYAAMILWWSGIWMINFFFVIAAKSHFSATNQEAFFALLLTTVTYVALAFPVGVLGDRIGHRPVLSGGLLVLCLVLGIVPFVSDMRSAYVLMVGAGVGYSVVLSVAYAFFVRLIPSDRTARLFGVYMACQNGSLVIANVLGGAAVEYLGPSFLFIGAALLVFSSVVIVSRIRG